MIDKVNQYQAKIKEFDLKSRMEARGIRLPYYTFDGCIREDFSGGGGVTCGDLTQIFDKINLLMKLHKLKELVDLCESQKIKTPNWLTPYLYCGTAYLGMGMRQKGIENLKYVVENAPGDPYYQKAGEILKQLNVISND